MSTTTAAAGDSKTSERVVTTKSGLQYVDRDVGDASKRPSRGDTVRVHYTGRLHDGTVFDSSHSRNEPLEFPVGNGHVIPGWDEGILSMNVGGKRKLIIPPNLGYGNRAVGSIPANSTLTFEVELVDIVNRRTSQADKLKGLNVITTPSGLRYTDHVVGSGSSPTTGSTVRVHYDGRLETGQMFDSSVQRGQPFEFQIGEGYVIEGWDEGVMSMKVGGKRTLVVPPNLGYGPQGTGPIPGNATLYFDVQLLAVK